MDSKQGEALTQKNQLQALLNKLEGKQGEEAHALCSHLQAEIDYLEGKVALEYQSFVEERRKEVEELKQLMSLFFILFSNQDFKIFKNTNTF